MEIVTLKSWADFGAVIERIRNDFTKRPEETTRKEHIWRAPHILFRGMPDACWPLETTLERKGSKRWSVEAYLELACRHVEEIEAFSGRRWDVGTYPALSQELKRRSTDTYLHLPAYDFLVYLRHHGFPSPLLDWTESPYVAAFFALATNHSSGAAVYCFIETPRGVKGGYVHEPKIQVMGPHARTHPRHFMQRAWYTIATERDEVSKQHFFCSHSQVLSASDGTQDVLVKVQIPASLRGDAIRALADYNINQFTLFPTEDALIKTMEMRLFDV